MLQIRLLIFVLGYFWSNILHSAIKFKASDDGFDKFKSGLEKVYFADAGRQLLSKIEELQGLLEKNVAQESRDFEEANLQALILKKNIKTCGIEFVKPSYDSSSKKFLFVSQENKALKLLLDNYQNYGKAVYMHHSRDFKKVLGSEDLSTICDLRLFEGDSESSFNLFNALSRECSTNAGKVMLRLLSLEVTSDIDKLNKRQNFIKMLVLSPKLLQSLSDALEKLKNYELDFFHFKELTTDNLESNILSYPYNNFFYGKAHWPFLVDLFFDARADLKQKMKRFLSNNVGFLSMRPSLSFMEDIATVLGMYQLCKTTSMEGMPKTWDLLTNFSSTSSSLSDVGSEFYSNFFEAYKKGFSNSLNRICSFGKISTYKQIFSLQTIIHPLNSVKSVFRTVDDIYQPLTVVPKGISIYYAIRSLYKTSKLLHRRYKRLVENIELVFKNSFERLVGFSKFVSGIRELEKILSANQSISNQSNFSLQLYKELNSCCLSQDFDVQTTLYFKGLLKSKAILKRQRKELLKNKKLLGNQISDSQEIVKLELELKNVEADLKEVEELLRIESLQDVRNCLQTLDSDIFLAKTPSFFEALIGFPSVVGQVSSSYKIIQKNFEYFQPAYQAIGELDVYVALAKTILSYQKNSTQKYCFVNFEKDSSRPHLKLKSGWNPLALEQFTDMVPDSRLVSYDIEFGSQNLDSTSNACINMLLMGPNASGKSTFMRGIFYSIWLAQTFGIAFADSMILTPFKFVFSLKKDVENTAQGLSTHKSQLVELKKLFNRIEMTQLAGEFCFVACDELFNGTNASDATANTLAILEALVFKFPNCLAIVASHLQQRMLDCETLTKQGFRFFRIDGKTRNLLLGKDLNAKENSTNLQLLSETGFDCKFVERVKELKELSI